MMRRPEQKEIAQKIAEQEKALGEVAEKLESLTKLLEAHGPNRSQSQQQVEMLLGQIGQTKNRLLGIKQTATTVEDLRINTTDGLIETALVAIESIESELNNPSIQEVISLYGGGGARSRTPSRISKLLPDREDKSPCGCSSCFAPLVRFFSLRRADAKPTLLQQPVGASYHTFENK